MWETRVRERGFHGGEERRGARGTAMGHVRCRCYHTGESLRGVSDMSLGKTTLSWKTSGCGGLGTRTNYVRRSLPCCRRPYAWMGGRPRPDTHLDPACTRVGATAATPPCREAVLRRCWDRLSRKKASSITARAYRSSSGNQRMSRLRRCLSHAHDQAPMRRIRPPGAGPPPTASNSRASA